MAIQYIICKGCGYSLCYLDRRLDECPMCTEPIPEEDRLDD